MALEQSSAPFLDSLDASTVPKSLQISVQKATLKIQSDPLSKKNWQLSAFWGVKMDFKPWIDLKKRGRVPLFNKKHINMLYISNNMLFISDNMLFISDNMLFNSNNMLFI